MGLPPPPPGQNGKRPVFGVHLTVTKLRWVSKTTTATQISFVVEFSAFVETLDLVNLAQVDLQNAGKFCLNFKLRLKTLKAIPVKAK